MNLKVSAFVAADGQPIVLKNYTNSKKSEIEEKLRFKDDPVSEMVASKRKRFLLDEEVKKKRKKVLGQENKDNSIEDEDEFDDDDEIETKILMAIENKIANKTEKKVQQEELVKNEPEPEDDIDWSDCDESEMSRSILEASMRMANEDLCDWSESEEITV